MHTTSSLLDIHERTHRSLAQLLDHCRGFSAQDLHRELEGFGIPSIQQQLHHEIGAERYWTGVLLGRLDIDEDSSQHPDVDALEAYRLEACTSTRGYLDGASDDELNTARTMTTWGPREQILAPAQVILRIATHYFHHQGQIIAMCRLLGRPAQGLDYPLP